MTTTALSTIAAALWPSLLKHLKALGRWLLDKVKRLGSAIVGYMTGKIDDFKRRFAGAKKDWRKRWLKGRIRRWSAALSWIRSREKGAYTFRWWDINRCHRDFVKQAKGIPLVAPGEREPKARRAV